VREDDADAEFLDDEGAVLKDGEVVAMAVKEAPLVWQTFPKGRVSLSGDAAVVTQNVDGEVALVTSGIEGSSRLRAPGHLYEKSSCRCCNSVV
jgi:hypothetical protein